MAGTGNTTRWAPQEGVYNDTWLCQRTADNGTNVCFSSSALCYDSNARDFDLLG